MRHAASIPPPTPSSGSPPTSLLDLSTMSRTSPSTVFTLFYIASYRLCAFPLFKSIMYFNHAVCDVWGHDAFKIDPVEIRDFGFVISVKQLNAL